MATVIPTSAGIETQEFVPLDDAARFYVAFGFWVPREHGDALQESKAEHWRSPKSLVDVPDDPFQGTCDPVQMERDDAIELAAELNAESMTADPRIWNACNEWHFVVEIGQGDEEVSRIDLRMNSDGTGREDRVMRRPLRVVHPTDEEMAQYPAPSVR